MWLLTRGLVLLLYAGPQHWVAGDVTYFAGSLAALPHQGIGHTLPEYPLAGVAVLGAPWVVAQAVGAGLVAYSWMVLVLALVADAAFTLLLLRERRPGRDASLAVWLLGVPLLGATVDARFDILPGVLAGSGVLLLAQRPRLAAGAGAVAAAIKLWPVLLVPALAAPRHSRGPVVRVVLAVGVVVAAGTVLLSGWGRLVSPLQFQDGRGLQIESVLASPAMAGWVLVPRDFTVSYASSHAYEVAGPGVQLLIHASTALTVLVVAVLAALWWRLWRAGGTTEAVGWVGLAAVAGVMVTSRVLSPQYLLWLLPLAAATVCVSGRQWSAQARWAAVLLCAVGLTQLEFPVYYGDLVAHHPGSGLAVTVLVLRNLLLVWLCGDAAVRAWRSTGAGQRGSELARQPPGPAGNVVRSLR